MSRYQLKTIELFALDAIDIFYADIEELANEARDIVDNAPGSLQDSPRNQTLAETADTLEGLVSSKEDAPAIENAPKAKIGISVLGGKKAGGESRAVRLANACSHASAGVEALRELEEGNEDLSTWLDTVEEHISEAEGCEFPGMFG